MLVYPTDNALTLKELVNKISICENVTDTKPTDTIQNGAKVSSGSCVVDTGMPPEPKRTKYEGVDDSAARSEEVKTLYDRFAEEEMQQPEGVRQFNRVLFIDSTWNQSNQIFRDERLKGGLSIRSLLLFLFIRNLLLFFSTFSSPTL